MASLAIASTARALPTVVISEFLADNRQGLADDDGEHSDWIELFNLTPFPVNLKGWSLTDQEDSKRKWTFPEVTIGPLQFLLVFSSGNDRRDPHKPLHTNFKLGKKGDYLALVEADGGTIASAFAPKYPPQRSDISYGLPEAFFKSLHGASGRFAGPLPAHTYLPIPTPGAENLPGADTAAVAPECPQPSGLYSQPVMVRLSCRTASVTIRYTLDGSRPTSMSTAYVNPLTIANSTVLRAAAFKPGSASSEVLTRTYLIADSVLRQDGAGRPPHWGAHEGWKVPADYEMDPEVVTNTPAARLDEALTALPTLALNLDPGDLLSEERGIYANPMEGGGDWERAASLEMFPWKNEPGWKAECGARVQGGFNRRPEECPKHSFRILFKKHTGHPALHQPVFGGAPEEFSELVLRGGCNNTWLHWNSEERRRGDYLRDQWMRETYAAMGRLSPRGRFVHLYLNGLYWGVYNLVERPDGPFLKSHLGGKAGDYEVRNADKILQGETNAWRNLMDLANSGLGSASAYQKIQGWIDLPAFIDYMALNLFAANADYDRSSNWYASRPDQEGGRFIFIVWDGERTLEEVEDNRIAYDDDQSPPRLFQKLRENPAFREAFARRVRELLGAGGALSASASGERYRRLAEGVEAALLLESARWGDYRRDVHRYKTEPYELYTVEAHWKPEVRRLLDDYFPKRPAVFTRQLSEAGLAQ
ncbi:MAG: CotH kinase family protein [Verrucomicrobia bacterium]|nr:CotH kinase family protein [Verrucomicrobiota bacterium]MBI3869623.1 CotH kinase family protein [Verrucomicrobiota bacterium]